MLSDRQGRKFVETLNGAIVDFNNNNVVFHLAHTLGAHTEVIQISLKEVHLKAMQNEGKHGAGPDCQKHQF